MIYEGVLAFFSTHNLSIAFIAGLLAGDILILLGMLVSAGKANLGYVIIFALIGCIIHDSAFYYIANSRFAHLVKKKFKLSKKKSNVARLIEKTSNGNYFLPLLMAKFIYGVRDAMVLYIAHNHKNYKKFIITSATADLIWLVVITSVGVLAGMGFDIFLRVFKGFEKFLFVSFLIFIFIFFLHKMTMYIVSKTLKVN